MFVADAGQGAARRRPAVVGALRPSSYGLVVAGSAYAGIIVVAYACLRWRRARGSASTGDVLTPILRPRRRTSVGSAVVVDGFLCC